MLRFIDRRGWWMYIYIYIYVKSPPKPSDTAAPSTNTVHRCRHRHRRTVCRARFPPLRHIRSVMPVDTTCVGRWASRFTRSVGAAAPHPPCPIYVLPTRIFLDVNIGTMRCGKRRGLAECQFRSRRRPSEQHHGTFHGESRGAVTCNAAAYFRVRMVCDWVVGF